MVVVLNHDNCDVQDNYIFFVCSVVLLWREQRC